MNIYFSKSVFIFLSLFLLSVLSSCNSSDSKDGKNKIYTSNGVGVSGTSSGEMYGGNLSDFKGRKSSGGNSSSGIDMPGSVSAPSAAISQVDVNNVPQRQIASASTNSQSQSRNFKTSNYNNSVLQQNAPKSDINITLKARATETSTTTNKETKGKATTAAKSGPQKAEPSKPGEVGLGSLPVGDGTWMLILMMGMYVMRKNFKAVMPSRG